MSFLGFVQERDMRKLLASAYLDAFTSGVVTLDPDRQYILILSGIAQTEIDLAQKALDEALALDERNIRIVIISTPGASLLEL